MEIPIPEEFWLHLAIAFVSGIIVFNLIQKFKELPFINKPVYLWVLNLCLTPIAYLFARYNGYYGIEHYAALWVALYSFIGAPTIYEM